MFEVKINSGEPQSFNSIGGAVMVGRLAAFLHPEHVHSTRQKLAKEGFVTWTHDGTTVTIKEV